MSERTILHKQIKDLQSCEDDARQIMLTYQVVFNKYRDKWLSIQATMAHLENKLEALK